MEDKMKQQYSLWHYGESIVFVSVILVIGFVLQLFFGKFDIRFISAPLNIIVGAIMLLSLIALSLFRKNKYYRWLSGVPLAVTLIITIGILCIFMGLIPQSQTVNPHQHDIYSLSGLRSITTSWYFILTYFLILFSLGATIIKRLFSFNIKDYAFYLNHIGLWILFFSAGPGAADRERYTMYVYEGKEESNAYRSDKEQKKLPMSITLNDFDMEEYPPKLVIIDHNSLIMQPEKKPSFFQIDKKNNTGRLLNWNIEIKEYIHRAINKEDGEYFETEMPGANPAVKIKATDSFTGETHEGWVYYGNMMQSFVALRLNDDYSIVMTRPEPKRYVSDLNIYMYGKEEEHVILEVNKPFRSGSWMIYQYGYDNKAGRLSTYTILEIVRDPWINGVYLGIWLLAVGSVCLLWSGNKKKLRDTKNDME